MIPVVKNRGLIMLQRLHEKVHGWLAWFVVGLIGITFVFFGASYYTSSRSSNQVKAEVNGDEISLMAFDTVYRRFKNSAQNYNQNSEQLFKQQALAQLVYETVLKQAATKNGYYVSKQQVQNEIIATPEFQEDGDFSSDRFRQLLSNNMLSESDYFNLLQNGMLNQQLKFSFVASDFILPNELNHFIEFANQKRDYRYLLISPKNFNNISQPTDKAINTYYQANKQSFKTPEKVAIKYIVLSMKKEMADTTVTEGELKTFYEENQASYTTPAMFKIKRIFLKGGLTEEGQPNKDLNKKIVAVEKALKTETFTKVSEQYSSDLLAAKATLHWQPVNSFAPSVQSELLDMKVSSISKPIVTGDGVEIVKLIEKKAPKLKPFDKVKTQIEKTLRSEKAQKIFQDKADKLADLSYQYPDELKSLAEKLGLQEQQSELVDANKGFTSSPLNSPKIMRAAMSDEVLKDKNNSQTIQVNDDALVVLRVSKHIASKVQPLPVIRNQIIAQLNKQARQQKAQLLAVALLNDIKSQKSIDQILKEKKLSWQNVKTAQREAREGTDSNINSLAFAQLYRKNQVNIAQSKLADGSIVLIEVSKVEPGTEKDISSEQLDLIKHQIASSYGIKSYETYIQALRKAAKVELKQ